MLVKIINIDNPSEKNQFHTSENIVGLYFDHKKEKEDLVHVLTKLIDDNKNNALFSNSNRLEKKEAVALLQNFKSPNKMDLNLVCPKYIDEMLKNLVDNYNKKQGLKHE